MTLAGSMSMVTIGLIPIRMNKEIIAQIWNNEPIAIGFIIALIVYYFIKGIRKVHE